METKGDRGRLQVWLPLELLDRLTAAAREGDRPVSREVVRRLEASFEPAARALLEQSGPTAVQRTASNDLTVHGYPPLVEKPARVPPVESGRMTEAVAAKKVAIAKVVAATGVVTASEVEKQPKVCPRAHYHRPGRYCTACGKSY